MLAYIHAALVLCLVNAVAIRPKHATELTVFHVNEASFPVAPVNMNTGNANGDAYFDFRSVDLPIECANVTKENAHDCKNAELVGKDIVITKLILEVDSHSFGTYGYCNLCVNGSDHIPGSNISCTDGKYNCICGAKPHSLEPPYVPCGPSVGMANLSSEFSRLKDNCTDELDCYKINMGRKLNNIVWYSTTESGWCDSATAQNCTWRVARSIKRVNKSCSDNALYNAVEENDSAGCFNGCPGFTSHHRNLTDPCWIRCFYRTVLGDNGQFPNATAKEGIDNKVLERAWAAPFASEDPKRGGCTALPMPPTA
jgi:hypothetical protein